jgi:hypothetical protein
MDCCNQSALYSDGHFCIFSPVPAAALLPQCSACLYPANGGPHGQKVKIPFTILFIVLMIAAVIIIPDSTMQRILSTFNSARQITWAGGFKFSPPRRNHDKNPLLVLAVVLLNLPPGSHDRA